MEQASTNSKDEESMKRKRYEEDFDNIGEYFFESDHLALKGNADYHNLLKVMVLLEAQRSQAIRDLDTLKQCHQDALADPLSFVQRLQNKEPMDLPTPQRVASLPNINWNKYALSENALPPTLSRWKKPVKPQEAVSKEDESEANKALVRGRVCDATKPASFNQLWTGQEQKKLEELLVLYPPEEVESRRWAKISEALGNRTPAQVASRVQKYFIKLSRAGLAVPGRAPSRNSVIQASGSRRGGLHRLTMMRMTSSFFRHQLPSVYMSDGQDMDNYPGPNMSYADTCLNFPDLQKINEDSDDEDQEELSHGGLWEDPQYQELLYLQKLKEEKTSALGLALHMGYKCDRCKCEPIVGTRWHCLDCPKESSIDFCSDCVDCQEETGAHNSSHQMEPVKSARIERPFLDGDYLHLMGSGTTCNYLDPNYMPATNL